MTVGNYKIDFADVKQRVSMTQVLTFLGLNLKQKTPRQWKGTCPFCHVAECFVTNDDGGKDKTGAFNCFRCSAGGDQLELVSLSRGHSRKDSQGTYAAAKELFEKFLQPATAQVQNTSVNASPQPKAERRQKFDAEAYIQSLDPAHANLAALELDPETFRAWCGGFSSSGVNRGRLALPIFDKDQTVLGFIGRALGDVSPALIFPNGLDPHAHIFGRDRVGSGALYLVRDPLDVLRAFESGCENVVCFLTEEITGIQLESLAALMDERQCSGLSFF